MLLPKPESRWSVERVLKRLTEILDKSGQHGVATEYCGEGKPRAINNANQFPPPWGDDEHRRRRYRHFDTQRSTQSDTTSSAFSGVSTPSRDTEHLADAVGSQHDFGQFENIFADHIPSSHCLGPGSIHSMVAATAAVPHGDGDIPQNGPSHQDNRPEIPSNETTDSSRQTLSLSPGFARMAGHLLDPSHAIVDQNSPYRALMRVNESIRVPQQPPEIEFLTTPATSHCPASSEAHSTYTEDPRPSMSSRTDLSIFEVEECSEQSHQPEDSHATGKYMPKPEAPAPPLVGGRPFLNGTERTDINSGVDGLGTHSSRRHGLVLVWKKLKSLRRKTFPPIQRRGQRRVECEGAGS
jgi:hypothetical protein